MSCSVFRAYFDKFSLLPGPKLRLSLSIMAAALYAMHPHDVNLYQAPHLLYMPGAQAIVDLPGVSIKSLQQVEQSLQEVFRGEILDTDENFLSSEYVRFNYSNPNKALFLLFKYAGNLYPIFVEHPENSMNLTFKVGENSVKASSKLESTGIAANYDDTETNIKCYIKAGIVREPRGPGDSHVSIENYELLPGRIKWD